MRRITIRVQRRTGLPGWWVRVGGLELECHSQAQAIREATSLALRHAQGGGTAEVIVHRVDGTISPRRATYPRSSDPRRSRG